MQSKMVLDRAKVGMFVLRVVLGAIFFAHGWDKLQNMDMIVGFFSQIGISPFFSYVVAWTELLAGLAIIFGIFTRIAGYLIIIVMLAAMYFVKFKAGFLGGYEFDLILLASALAIAWTGPGMFSIAGRVCGCGNCMLCGGGMIMKKKGGTCDRCEDCKDNCNNHEVIK